jgi:hypothetical protein
MSDDAKQAWSEVGEKFSSWGHRVADRYHEAGSPEAAEEEKTRELERVAKQLIDEVSRGFSALGKTLRDDQGNKDLGDAVSAIGDAITASVHEVTRSIRTGGTGSGAPPRSDDDQKPPA